LEVSESIALHRDLEGLFHDLAGRLHRVVQFDFLNLTLHDEERDTMRLHILETELPSPVETGLESPIAESMAGWVWQHQQPLVIDELNAAWEARYPKLTRIIQQRGIRSLCLLPLTTAQHRLGALGFGSRAASAYEDIDLQFLAQVAAQVAVAVDNALNAEAAKLYQQQLARERDRLRVVLDVTNAMVSNLDTRQLFQTISKSLRPVLRLDYSSLVLHDPETGVYRLHSIDFPGGPDCLPETLTGHLDDSSPAGVAVRTRRPVLVDGLDNSVYPSEIFQRLCSEGLRSFICTPLVTHDNVIGTLNVGSYIADAFTQDDVDLLAQIGNEAAIAIENARSYAQIAILKDKLAEEKLYLEDEIRTEYDFEEIIGESPLWKRVLRDVETVAPTDSTVFIRGESGTGKELIARAIHNLSQRRGRTFVKINCAAIPTGLLESELFGHERGAFTGAIAQKIGRFELADGGTLFLDEIGDIPIELQPKLLRVLQEREFERLGSTRTLQVSVRLVTATNRDLDAMVAAREFRQDLFYRVNVFPIVLPPLRERPEDIPLLVRYFAQKYASRMDKHIETIPAEAMEALTRWSWPGNVRELENLIERSVILTRGPVLHVPLGELRSNSEPATASATLAAAEREHILRVLRETNWVLSGPKGAATRLGMKRTTLQSRMQKLGITRS
jgi:formate hydrogenlyase transcriptional activator